MDRNSPAIAIARWGLLLLPLAFLAVFYFYPLGSIFAVGLVEDGRVNLTGFTQIASGYYLRTLWFTTWQAVVSTVLTLALALPAAVVFVRYRFPAKNLLLSVSTLPFVLPTVIVAAAFTALLGRQGIVNEVLMSVFELERGPLQLERTLWMVFIAHVFYNYAVALRMIAGYWANQSPRVEEAARALGANGWRLWWEVRLPVLRPALTAAALLVFIFTFTSFGIILILGGVKYATLEVEIYRQATAMFNLPVAAALSIVQIGVVVAMMVFYTRIQRGNAASGLESVGQIAKRPENRREWTFVWGNVGVMVLLTFGPLAALLAQSVLIDGRLSLSAYTMLNETSRRSVLFVPPLEAVWNSLRFAGVAVVLSVMMGTLASYLLTRRNRTLTGLLDPLFMLPLATSAVTLGFGFIVALDEPPLNLRTSWWLIPLAHTLVAMPFVVRSVLPSLRSIPANLSEAAATLGASPLGILRHIDLPLVSRGVAVGAAFAFTMSMGEFGATIFIARPDTPTIPIVIFRLLGQPGIANYGQAMAMSTVLVLVCATAFVLIERIRTAGVGEF